MQGQPSASHILTERQVWLVCVFALALHVCPIIFADYPYQDDVWRAQLAGNDWMDTGRPMAALLFALTGGSASAVNVFPLPLLLAVVVTASSFSRLVKYWFDAPTFSSVLVVLPLWYNPFFLQNLSYQYDSASTAFSMVAAVWAVSLGCDSAKARLVGAMLVAMAAGFYQVGLNVFVALCGVDLLWQIARGGSLRQALGSVWGRLLQLVGGCALYYLACAWMISVDRTRLLPFDIQWPAVVLERMRTVAADAGQLFTPGNSWLAWTMLVLAMLGLVQVLLAVWARHCRWQEKTALSLLLLGTPLLIGMMLSGLMLLFDFFDHEARMLMGFGSAVVGIALFSRLTLERLNRCLGLVLLLPLLCMLSFSFAYGRVLVVEKTFQQSVATGLAHDITSRTALASAHRYYLYDIRSSAGWLPAASGSMQENPALRYVLNVKFVLLPEMMPRFGLSNFGSHPPLERDDVLERSPSAVVENKFYDIHLVDDVGYVLMKPPRDPEGYRW